MMPEAEALLAEVESLRVRDPKAALRRLERESPALREAFGIGGALHPAFRMAVSALHAQLDPSRPSAPAPGVSVISWDAVPDLGALARAAQGGTAEIIYIAPPDRRRDAPPMAQLRALDEFADPRVGMVVVGEGPPILVRTGFIRSAAVSLDPRTDIADAPQELLDFAGRSGYTARFTR